MKSTHGRRMQRRDVVKIASAAVGLGLVAGSSPSELFAAEPRPRAPIAPAKAVLTVGDVAIGRVEEVRTRASITDFTRDQDLVAANRHWLAPHFLDANDQFDLVFQSYVFEADGRVVVVDPCNGNGRPSVTPLFDHLDVPYIERLGETGVRPEDVDIVVCTHLHHDHCGWNTQLRDGKWTPTFPKARYIMSETEYRRWGPESDRHPPYPLNNGVFDRSVRPVVDAGLADRISGSYRLTEGMVVEPAPGHTLGHQMLHLTSAGRHALFSGDCFHHPIQLADPSVPFGVYEDPVAVRATRIRLAEMAADLGALIIAAHVQAPYAVRAWREGGSIRFAAADPNGLGAATS